MVLNQPIKQNTFREKAIVLRDSGSDFTGEFPDLIKNQPLVSFAVFPPYLFLP